MARFRSEAVMARRMEEIVEMEYSRVLLCCGCQMRGEGFKGVDGAGTR